MEDSVENCDVDSDASGLTGLPIPEGCLRVRPVGVVNGQSGPGWESESSQGPAGMMATGQRAGVSGAMRVVGRWAGPGLGSETRRRSSEARTCRAGAK